VGLCEAQVLQGSLNSTFELVIVNSSRGEFCSQYVVIRFLMLVCI